MIKPHRSHPLWFAFILHRLSGLLLAVFLPVHFTLLAFAVTEPARLDQFLRFADLTPVKIAEFGLVFLLTIHVFGGLRLMALEWLPWSAHQKTLAASSFAVAIFIATIFFLQAY